MNWTRLQHWLEGHGIYPRVRCHYCKKRVLGIAWLDRPAKLRECSTCILDEIIKARES